ncbi:MAG: class I SAM-dependent methyltransferase [Candidatus Hodarchaeales archaeon]
MIEGSTSFYETAWLRSCVREPSFWPIHDVLNGIAQQVTSGNRREILEIGPGTWPKTPINRAVFLEPTVNGKDKLSKAGGYCVLGSAEEMPFPDDEYPLICAFEVLEHIRRCDKAFSEISRVIKPGGVFIFSTPVNMDYWSEFDAFAGHVRRFSPRILLSSLTANDFEILAFRGRKDSPKLINNLNARLRISSPRLMECLTKIILDFLERNRNRFLASLFRLVFKDTQWRDGVIFLEEARWMGNVTIIARKKK